MHGSNRKGQGKILSVDEWWKRVLDHRLRAEGPTDSLGSSRHGLTWGRVASQCHDTVLWCDTVSRAPRAPFRREGEVVPQDHADLERDGR